MAAHDEQIVGSEGGPSEPAFLIIGRIARPHGVRGQVRVTIHSDLPERFNWLERVYVGHDVPHPMPVEEVRFHQGAVILKLGGCDSRNEAEALRGQWLQVPRSEAIPLEDDEVFLYQLIGLQVETRDGEPLGELVEVIRTGANDVYLVRGPAGDLLLPDIAEVILQVDVAAGRMVVHLLEGLRDT